MKFDDRDLFQRDMRQFRKTMFRYMALFWFFAPYILFAPLWNAVHATPSDQGGAWFGFGLVAVLVLPFWVAMLVVGRRLRDAMNDLDDQEDRLHEAREAKRALMVRRAQRLERAEARLARIQAERLQREQGEIVEDLERIRDGLRKTDG